MNSPMVIVVSLLDGKGPTGVEAHFTQLIDAARAAGIVAVLVAPYPAQRLWATMARQLLPALRLVSREGAAVVSLRINAAVLAGKLAGVLAQARQGAAVTLYAQDPVSARVALAARRRHHCRVVTVIHYNASQSEELTDRGEARADGPVCRFLDAAEAAALPHVDHLLFVSRFMQRALGRRMPALDAVPQSVIPNFASPVEAVSGTVALDGDLIAIGTLEARKNQAFLLHVLASAKARGCVYTLTLVGNGPDEAMLRALASQLGVADQVTFAGFAPHAARLIARHRILVHAALIENLPVALIEALAAGRPILAPAVGGIPEVFSDGVEGYFWPLDDCDAAAGLLEKVLADAATYGRMAQAARLRYQLNFHADGLVNRWLAAITGATPAASTAVNACQLEPQRGQPAPQAAP